MKKIIEEFKAFVLRGNVFDMAIGVIIATSFGKITTSLVNDVMMPIIGQITGGIDLSKLNICIQPSKYDEAGILIEEAVNIGIGSFLSTVIDFIIVALVIFIVVKSINAANAKFAKQKKEEEKEKGPTTDELLSSILEEIKKKK